MLCLLSTPNDVYASREYFPCCVIWEMALSENCCYIWVNVEEKFFFSSLRDLNPNGTAV